MILWDEQTRQLNLGWSLFFGFESWVFLAVCGQIWQKFFGTYNCTKCLLI